MSIEQINKVFKAHIPDHAAKLVALTLAYNANDQTENLALKTLARKTLNGGA